VLKNGQKYLNRNLRVSRVSIFLVSKNKNT